MTFKSDVDAVLTHNDSYESGGVIPWVESKLLTFATDLIAESYYINAKLYKRLRDR